MFVVAQNSRCSSANFAGNPNRDLSERTNNFVAGTNFSLRIG